MAILANIVRGHLQAGDVAKAQDYLNKAVALQPAAPALGTLKVMFWNRTEETREAATLAKELLQAGNMDPDLVRAAYFLGMRHRDPELAILALEIRIKNWPNQAVDGWLKLGHIYNAPEAKNETKALQAYKSAVDAAQAPHKNAILTIRAIAFEISTAEFCISATGLKANADILSLKSCSASMKN